MTTTAAPSREDRTVVALGGIIWAYFDRVAAGDAVKAAAVLSNFQGLYNTAASAVRTVADAGGVTAPRALVASGAWSANTRLAAQIVLAASAARSDADVALLESMPDAAASLGPWFRDSLRTAFPAPAVFASTAELVQRTSAAAMSVTLTQLFGELTQGGSPTGPMIDTSRLFRSSAPSSTAAVDSVTTIAEPLQVVGTAVKSQMPLWGWIALGTGALVAAGVLAWGVWTKPRGR